jgi:thiol-disulfide isomerase/thioredoxin
MALTPSNMLELGTVAPDFTLPDTVSGANISLADVRSDHATVIMFLCNHCPYVVHINPEIARIVADYAPKGVCFVGISSNDAEKYPDDAPDKMTVHAAESNYNFPYLYDESQDVARAYDAACTPDFYIFDQGLTLVYRGRLDDSRPRVEQPKPLTGKDLREALDGVLNKQVVNEVQYPSMGCNIKWKQ